MKYLAFRICFIAVVSAMIMSTTYSYAQNWRNIDGDIKAKNHSMFRPIEDWPAPNSIRNAGGAPGQSYWQQRADYVIRASLDTTNHVIKGSERITYHNNSPDALRFVWVQLDQNVVSLEHSRSYKTATALPERISPAFRQFVGATQFDGGYDISRVQLVGTNGVLTDASYFINDTIMRVNLDGALQPGSAVSFDIDWTYAIPNGGRGAKEKVRDGSALKSDLISSGEEQEGQESMWWYMIQYQSPEPIQALHFTNTLLLESFEDQKNIVQVQHFPSEKSWSLYFVEDNVEYTVNFASK